MSYKSLSQSVSDFRTMASGINTRLTTLTTVGITAADVTALTTFADDLDALNAQQEELKAQLKVKTDELNEKLAKAREKSSDLSKRIKIGAPQEEWVAFGISAKR